MNISYDLWPIWCDYLEEQGQDTELLRYVLTYRLSIVTGFVYHTKSTHGIEFHASGYFYSNYEYGNGIAYSAYRDTNEEYGNRSSLEYISWQGGKCFGY